MGTESINAGTIMLQPGSSTFTNNLANFLGILPEHLSPQNNKSFVVGMLKRESKVRWLQENILKAAVQSELNGISENDLPSVINFFNQHGTHYLSRYTVGDFIYQVYVYDRDIYDQVDEQYSKGMYRNGYLTFEFAQYTEPRVTSAGVTTGYTAYIGDLHIASRQEQFYSDLVSQAMDNTFARKASILRIPRIASTLTSIGTEDIVVALQFTDIGSHISNEIAKDIWDNLLLSALYLKYGERVQSTREQEQADYTGYFSDFSKDYITSIATTDVAIIRMHADLSEIQFNVLSSDQLQRLFVFADIVEMSDNVHLPICSSLTIICKSLVPSGSRIQGRVPTIVVGSSECTPKVNLYVGDIKEPFVIQQQNSGKRESYIRGIALKLTENPSPSNPMTVEIDSDKSLTNPTITAAPSLYAPNERFPEEVWVSKHFKQGMQFIALVTEVILSYKFLERSNEISWNTVDWIIDTLHVSGDSLITPVVGEDLQIPLTRAFALKKMHFSDISVTSKFVPYSSYKAYKPLIDSLLSVVEQYETYIDETEEQIYRMKETHRLATNQAELNANIKEIGNYMNQRTKIAIEKENDISTYKDLMNDKAMSDINKLEAEAVNLLGELKTASDTLKSRADDLKRAIEREIVIGTFTMLFDLVTAIGSIVAGAGSVSVAKITADLPKAALTLEKMKFAFAILDSIGSLYKAATEAGFKYSAAASGMSQLPDGNIDTSKFPTSLDWDDFDAEVLHAVLKLPDGVKREAQDYRLAATKLSKRARAYLSTANQISKLRYDIVKRNYEKDIAQNNANRLSDLSHQMNLVKVNKALPSTVDLFQYANTLTTSANTVRLQLLDTFIQMDAALQFEYSADPVLLRSFDLLSIKTALVTHEQNAIAAFQRLGIFSERTETYTIENVAFSDLLSPECIIHPIFPNASLFSPYIHIRVETVYVSFDGISQTSTGNVFGSALMNGEVLWDKMMSGEVRDFSTINQRFDTEYNINSGQLISRQSISSDKIKPTPFSFWTICIPSNSPINQNLQHSSGTTNVHLKFKFAYVYGTRRRRKIWRRSYLFASNQA